MNQSSPPDEVRETGCLIVAIGAVIACMILAYLISNHFAI